MPPLLGVVVVVVVVGLQESQMLWYAPEHGSDPPSQLLYHRLAEGVENGHRFSTCGFRLSGRLGDGRRSR